ncbi:MAG: class I SAM-dependent methyltransferase [Chloroflexales bacterium]
MTQTEPARLADLWRAMDRAWDDLGLDNRAPNPTDMAAFYRHPIWEMNGRFTERDPVSRGHRAAITSWLRSVDAPTILDYGGGYGGLARMIAAALPDRRIDIYEPFPSQSALDRAAAFPNLHYVGQIPPGYACALCVDVLEHVPDPLAVLADIAASLRLGGYLADASNFYPLIKCHLPATFHLRYSFPAFARMLGMHRLGRIVGSHATAYQKISAAAPNWDRLRTAESLSRMFYPTLRQAHRIYRAARRRNDDVSL